MWHRDGHEAVRLTDRKSPSVSLLKLMLCSTDLSDVATTRRSARSSKPYFLRTPNRLFPYFQSHLISSARSLWNVWSHTSFLTVLPLNLHANPSLALHSLFRISSPDLESVERLLGLRGVYPRPQFSKEVADTKGSFVITW